MPATPSLTIISTFPYRGADEEMSQTYHFNGGTPADAAHWKTFADAVIADLADLMFTDASVVRAMGHKAGVVAADWQYDYAAHAESVAGTRSIGTGPVTSGDEAVWLRWPTTAVTSKGKPIFLRTYFHHVLKAGGTPPNSDKLQSTIKSDMETYGASWVSGYSDGTNTYVRAGPNGATGGTALASTYLTTRTLERRGRRKKV